MALRKLRRNEEAVSAYQRAIRENPDFAVPYKNLGVVLEQMGRAGERVVRIGGKKGWVKVRVQATGRKGWVAARLVGKATLKKQPEITEEWSTPDK